MSLSRQIQKNDGAARRAHEDGFGDARMEMIIGRLLQTGVLLSATVMLVGGVMYTRAHAGEPANYTVFVPRRIQVLNLRPLLKGIAACQPAAVLQAGILLLIATPICRVMFAVVAFVLERDRLYVAVSLMVLAVLLAAMVRGG